MFIDTSVFVAILSKENDAAHLAALLEQASAKVTSALVVLETVMRLSTKLNLDPIDVEAMVSDFMREAEIEIVPIAANEGKLAIEAFAVYGKGRGHPAQLNLADCLSYACAKSGGYSLLYKGSDFARTEMA